LIIYEVKRALPRAWGVGETVRVDSEAAAIATVAEAGFDPGTQAVVVEGGLTSSDGSQVKGNFPTDLVKYASNRMELETAFTSDGLLVVSSRYDESWRATVDGREVDVVRADGILMAVPVPAGKHQVELEFTSADVTWGRRITVVTLVLTFLALAAYSLYQFRRRAV
jgi:hypothetical protein